MGLTEYIDFLTPEEVPYNKVKGIDMYRRPFIILKVGIYDLKNTKLYKTGQVFFQRYSPSYLPHPCYFYGKGHHFEGSFIDTVGGINKHQIKLISDIVDNKLVKFHEDHRGVGVLNDDEKFIASMDYWENSAARVIQKNFLICRYNPKYALCRKILNRQFDEYVGGISDNYSVPVLIVC